MTIDTLRRRLVFVLSFGFARGALFVAPILLANWLPSSVYGAVEWAHATASLFATLVTLGVSGALPLIVINKLSEGTLAGVFAHHIIVSIISFTVIALAWILNANDTLLLTVSMIVVMSLQSLWSLQLKTNGKGEASLILDACLFTLIAITALVSSYLQVDNVKSHIILVVIFYAVCLNAVTARALSKRLHLGEALKYKTTLMVGIPLMLTILVNILVASSGRMAIGILGGVLLTADYAILARAAAVPIVAHQIILVAKFRDLYALPSDKMEKIMLLILSMVLSVVVILWLTSPLISWILGAAFANALKTHSLSGFLILAQAILWSAISLNDTVNARQQTIKKVLPWCGLFIVISIPIAMLWINFIGISLAHFVYVHGALMLLFYLVQVYAMYRAGIRLLKVWTLAAGSFVALIICMCFLHFI